MGAPLTFDIAIPKPRVKKPPAPGVAQADWRPQHAKPCNDLQLRSLYLDLGLADGALLAQLGSAPDFTRFFVMRPLPQLLLQTTPLQELLETP